MKRIIFFMFIAISQISHCSDFETNGTINFTRAVLGQGAISILPRMILMNRQDYTNGGLTFTYDVPFINIPRVLITIELNNPPSPTETYSAVISANSSTSVTVMVYKISSGGAVAEALTSEVKVTIFAVDNF